MYQALPEFIHIKDSPVAGQGLFAKEDIPEGVDLGVSHIIVDNPFPHSTTLIRTPLGGFVNHSETPNCVKWAERETWGETYYMKTTKEIKVGEELFLCYTFYSVLDD